MIPARIGAYSPIDMSHIESDNSKNEEINRDESTEEYNHNEDIRQNDSREELVGDFRLFESFSQTKELSNISINTESSYGIEPIHSMMLHMSEATEVSATARRVPRNRKRGNDVTGCFNITTKLYKSPLTASEIIKRT